MHNSDVWALTLDSPYLKKNGTLHFFPGAVREKNKTGNFVREIYPGFSSFFFFFFLRDYRQRAPIFTIQLGKRSQGVPLWCLSFRLCILDLSPPSHLKPSDSTKDSFLFLLYNTPDSHVPCSQSESKWFILEAVINKENPRQIFIPASFKFFHY